MLQSVPSFEEIHQRLGKDFYRQNHAESLAKEFALVHQAIRDLDAKVDKRLDIVEERLGRIEHFQSELAEFAGNVVKVLQAMDKRLDNMDKRLKDLSG